MKIREMKLQTKYKQLTQKHQNLKKFTHSPITQLDVDQTDNIDLIENYDKTRTGRVVAASIKN